MLVFDSFSILSGSKRFEGINGKQTKCFQGVGLLNDSGVTESVTNENSGFSPLGSPKPDTAVCAVTVVTADTIKVPMEPYAKAENEKFSVTKVTTVTNTECLNDLASQSHKPPHTSCTTTVTPQPAGGNATNGGFSILSGLKRFEGAHKTPRRNLAWCFRYAKKIPYPR